MPLNRHFSPFFTYPTVKNGILAYSKTKIHTYYIMAHGDLYEYTRKVNKVV